MKEIEKYIETYFGIGGKYLSPVGELFRKSVLPKNEFFLKTGQYTNQLSFVKAGYLRIYASDGSGEKDVTQWISREGTFVTDLGSFLFAAPARWNIQALSDCELYTITKDDYHSIGEQVDNWQHLEKLFIAKCFVTLENRVFNQLSMTAEQKVRQLMADDSSIFLQVPLQYIASMLGMTPETLSRIRRKLSS